MKINVLGTEYTVKVGKEVAEYPLLEGNAGIVNYIRKEIIIGSQQHLVVEDDELEEVVKEVIRHELVHAFLFESGLNNCSDWATNEELVDWLAIQLPKIFTTMQNYSLL